MADLNRFVTAQSKTHNQAKAEIADGHKQSHWMWWEFPQLRGLGRSQRAYIYGLADLSEATAYLAHPVLGTRLVEMMELTLSHKDLSAQEIFGSVDARKLQSCATLFSETPQASPVFSEVLCTFFQGMPCRLTLDEIQLK